jgi:hypothetical protein
MGMSEYSLVAETKGAIGAHGVIMVISWIFMTQAAEVIAWYVSNKVRKSLYHFRQRKQVDRPMYM